MAGRVMVSGHWRPLADAEALLRILNHPGHADQKSHGRRGGGRTGQGALDAVPAKLAPGPEGHFGNYEGESLSGPAGMGSVRALSEYEGVEYQATNSYLRGQFREGYVPSGAAERVAEMDKTMAVSKLTDSVQVERVIQDGASVFGGPAYRGSDFYGDDFATARRALQRWQDGERPSLAGIRFRDKGYVSTSADPRIDQAFGGRWARTAKENPGQLEGEPVVMKIQVPNGTGAVQLGEMGEMGSRGLTGSAEILLDRGLSYEVTADHGVDADGFRRLDVSVIFDG